MVTDYLTPDEVASRLQVSRQVVYNWINDGRLRAVKAGRTLRIPHFALDAFLQPVPGGKNKQRRVKPSPGFFFHPLPPPRKKSCQGGGKQSAHPPARTN